MKTLEEIPVFFHSGGKTRLRYFWDNAIILNAESSLWHSKRDKKT